MRRRYTAAERPRVATRMAEAYNAGRTIRQIAADYGVSYTLTQAMLREGGAAMRPRGKPFRRD